MDGPIGRRHDTQYNDIQKNDTEHNILIMTLSIKALNVGIPSVILLNVIYVECRKLAHYNECYYSGLRKIAR